MVIFSFHFLKKYFLYCQWFAIFRIFFFFYININTQSIVCGFCFLVNITILKFSFSLFYSESNSLSPPFFTSNNGTGQKGRPRKRKLMINQHQNDALNLGTAMQMGKLYFQIICLVRWMWETPNCLLLVLSQCFSITFFSLSFSRSLSLTSV